MKLEDELIIISNSLHEAYIALALTTLTDIEDLDNQEPLTKAARLLHESLEILDSQIQHSNTFLLLKANGELKEVNIPLEPSSLFNSHIHSLISSEIYELVSFGDDCHSFYFIVDELGKVRNFPKAINLKATSIFPGSKYGDYIVGDVVIGKHGYINGEPDVIGLSQEDIEVLREFLGDKK